MSNHHVHFIYKPNAFLMIWKATLVLPTDSGKSCLQKSKHYKRINITKIIISGDCGQDFRQRPSLRPGPIKGFALCRGQVTARLRPGYKMISKEGFTLT